MTEKRRQQIGIFHRVQAALAQVTMERTGDLSHGPHGGNQRVRPRNCATHLTRVRLVQVEFGDVGGVEIHYRSRSSEMNCVLSPVSCGKSFQKRLISPKSGFLWGWSS